MRSKFIVRTAALVALICGVTNANADDKACSRAAKVAETLMQVRQQGVSLQNAMDSMLSSYPKSAHPLVRKLVMDAYAIPRYNSPEYQQRATGEFRDQAHLTCLKAG